SACPVPPRGSSRSSVAFRPVHPHSRDQEMPKTTAIVTGGAGFIGSHLVDGLLADAWRVVVIDDLSTGEGDRVASEASLNVVDITNRESLDAVVDEASPAVIFHLAAQSSVTRSVADPKRDAEVNVLGTLNVLEAA